MGAKTTSRSRAFIMIALLAGCQCERETSVDAAGGDTQPPWDVVPPQPPARAGMVWVPAGTLIAGTPPGVLPRIADQELPGVSVQLTGFFIDRYNYPPEPGAIPKTGLTQAEARAICEAQDKRLCTELEWERACKGPSNTTYEYGDRYDPEICGTGTTDVSAPNGVNAACESRFGVRDMHGSAWNWTSSAWERDTRGDAVAVRGGNGDDGELVGRCANGRGLSPSKRDPRVGVRCCAGEANAPKVALAVTRGSELAYRPFDPRIGEALEAFVPDEITAAVKGRPPADRFRVERLWMWRPIGNEELIVGGGCAHPPGHDACGIVVARSVGEEITELAFVSSDWWIPTVGEHEDDRTLYLYGGDIGGAYRKPVIYEWGRIGEGDKQRKKGGGWLRP